ncbi:hypothetical protein [Nitrosopumilus sp.]|uniref:hypothetical protein n=1 Tax=Nitrosopumilus sp. TaxID=2024843 RepID=UPI003B594803
MAIFLVLVGLGLITFTAYPVSAQSADSDDGVSKSGILVATTNTSTFNIPYSITVGTVNDAIPVCDSASIIVTFDSDKTGELTLEIPRNLLDAKLDGVDDEFFVILDGEEIPYEETSKNHSREIMILFESGPHELEIIASWDLSLESKRVSCHAVHEPPYSYILTPLKQFNSGTPYHETVCKPGLQLTQKHDKSPACVSPETYFELIKRDWTSNIIKAVQSRDLSSDIDTALSSYMNKITPTLDDFKNVLSEPYDIDEIFSKFGEPHDDIGSGIHIYVYDLNDDTEIWIGYVDDIWYMHHVDSKGNLIEELFAKPPDYVTPFQELQVDITGEQQVRRGTTHDIVVDVFRDAKPVSDATVRITIEDYGEDVIRDFKGRTDDSGRFVFSWEIPKSFDDVKTLLAYVDVTDDVSAKTALFKFQVYCIPGETGCKAEGR